MTAVAGHNLCLLLGFHTRGDVTNVAGRRLWTDKELIEMIHKILDGQTYRDVMHVVPLFLCQRYGQGCFSVFYESLCINGILDNSSW